MTDATITKLLEAPTDELVRPDDEEAQVIVNELSTAKRALYELEQVRHYDELEVDGYPGLTVGRHLYGPTNGGGKRQLPAGYKLTQAIAVCQARVADAQARYDAHLAREQAWIDSRQPAKTDEPAA